MNRDSLLDAMEDLNNRMNMIVDDMITVYGRFVTLKDYKEFNSNDNYMLDLISSYNKLQEKKDYIQSELDLNN